MLDWFRKMLREGNDEKKLPVLPNLWESESNALTAERPSCNCLDAQHQELNKRRWRKLTLHDEPQDTSSSAWKRLLELVEEAAADAREEFSPGREMDANDWTTIVTLPPTISKLKSVKHLCLYGSSLIRIPPEIGGMTSLQKFTPYTSYRLHWFPYEITRCKNLVDSSVSTRAIYGNFKYRPPFPKLPQLTSTLVPPRCSVCNGAFSQDGPLQYWISLKVATDVLPLLVHACSEECIARVPAPPGNYVSKPHQGGQEIQQPAVDDFYNSAGSKLTPQSPCECV